MTYHILFPGTPEKSIQVTDIDPKFTYKLETTKSLTVESENLPPRKVNFRYSLYTEQNRSLLLIFQAPVKGGKDGLFILSVP